MCTNVYIHRMSTYYHIMRSRRVSGTQGIGAAIREERLEHELTQAQLASRAHVSREWLSGVERGERTGAELSKVLRVLSALDLELSIASTKEGAAVAAPAKRSEEATTPTPPPLTTLDATHKALTAAAILGARATRFARSTTLDQNDALREAMRQASETMTDRLRTNSSLHLPAPELSKTASAALRPFSARTSPGEESRRQENSDGDR